MTLLPTVCCNQTDAECSHIMLSVQDVSASGLYKNEAFMPQLMMLVEWVGFHQATKSGDAVLAWTKPRRHPAPPSQGHPDYAPVG
mmetsp:Transcript_20298/g.36934  ORF Transcript_20298/g.36934 Transcript_20298/m.36934 type:complete len:85 (+) Transcript_20298:117-371(+)